MASHLQRVEKHFFLLFVLPSQIPVLLLVSAKYILYTIWRVIKVKKSWQGQVLICEILENVWGEQLLTMCIRPRHCCSVFAILMQVTLQLLPVHYNNIPKHKLDKAKQSLGKIHLSLVLQID